MPPFHPFIGPSYQSQSPIADAEELVNWFVAKLESPGATVPTMLLPTPGFLTLATLPESPIRAEFYHEGRFFVVAGTAFREVNNDWSSTLRNGATPMLQDTNPATITVNGDAGHQLLITSGGHKYCFDLTTNTFTDQGAGATMGGMLDTFFLALDATTSVLTISASLDGTSWDPTEETSRTTAPDPWRAMVVTNKRIYLFGDYTGDVYYDSGAASFPFVPFDAQIPCGTAAKFSPVPFGGGIAFLAQTRHGQRTVQLLQGYTSLTKISTHAIDYLLSTLDSVDDAEGFTYEDAGVESYVLNFPKGNLSIVFDQEGGWHKRGTWDQANNRFNVWAPRCHAIAHFGYHVVGDRTNGNLYRMSPSLGLDANGGVLRRLRRGPTLFNSDQLVFVNNFHVVLEPGLGLAVGQGADPQLALRISRNGGKTWGTERWKGAGLQGEYGRRVVWERCGSGYRWTPELVVTDPIPWRITDALINEPQVSLQ